MKYNEAPSHDIPNRNNGARNQWSELRSRTIACTRCASKRVGRFNAEMNIHFPAYEGLTKPTVWVFPEVMVCLDCGCAEFSIAEPELRRLGEDDLGTVRSQVAYGCQ